MVGCIVFGALIVRAPLMALVLLGVVGGLVIYIAAPQWMAYLAMFAAFAALPSSVPSGKTFGIVAIFAHEVLIFLAITFLIPLNRKRMSSLDILSTPLIFGAAVMFSVAVGVLNGNEPKWIFEEARSLFMLAAGFMLGALLIGANLVRQSIRVVAVTLWFSAPMVLLASTTGLAVRGRNEGLSSSGDAIAGVVRIVSWTNMLALAVLTALLAMVTMSVRIRLDAWITLGLPALVITVLSFSRHSLIALGFAAVVAMLIGVNSKLPFQRLARMMMVGGAVFAVSIAAYHLLRLSGAGWVSDQLAGYSQRVLGGFSLGTGRDVSLDFRLAEIRRLSSAIREAPFLGHGLGYPYQSSLGRQDPYVGASYRPYFSLNFYLWLFAKAGIVGMIAFVWFTLLSIARGLRSASQNAKVSAIVAASFLAISFAWPVPELSPDSIVLGIALGAATAFSRTPRKSLKASTQPK